MKTIFNKVAIVLIGFTLLFKSTQFCFSQTNEQKLDSLIILKGKVIDRITRSPLENVIVNILYKLDTQGSYTNEIGQFEFVVPRNVDVSIEIESDRYHFFKRNITSEEIASDSIFNIGEIGLEKIVIMENITFNDPTLPWPPPMPTYSKLVPIEYFKDCENLFNVNEKLKAALEKAEYTEHSYYLVPAKDGSYGFALATQVEQTDKKGKPKKPNRFVQDTRNNEFSFSDYFYQIFFAEEGYFRVIVFIVTDVPFQSRKIDEMDVYNNIKDFATLGYKVLPDIIGSKEFTNELYITALIYEYYSPKEGEPASFVTPGKIQLKKHLRNSKIWREFKDK